MRFSQGSYHLAAKRKFNPAKVITSEIESLLYDIAELVDSNFAHYKNSRFEDAVELVESSRVEEMIKETVADILEKMGPVEP